MGSALKQRHTLAAVLLAGLALGLPKAAGAQEYCVACTGPEATYRCAIEQAAPTGVPLKLLCISTLAREGGHETCAVRGGTVFDCKGPLKRIDAKMAADAATAPPAGTATAERPGDPSATPVAAPPPRPPASEPPQTVEELAKRVTKSSGESLNKAGSAIAGTTRKAWTCLTSLFKSC